MLQDMAIFTGGQVISEEVGLSLETADTSLLGQAPRSSSLWDETTIVEGAGDSRGHRRPGRPGSVADREQRLRLRPRAAGASGQAGRRCCGDQGRRGHRGRAQGRKHRIGTPCATPKAAVEEGIVAGGGVALLQSAPALDELSLSGDEATGANIVRVALEAPLKQIAFNAGLGRALSPRRSATRSPVPA